MVCPGICAERSAPGEAASRLPTPAARIARKATPFSGLTLAKGAEIPDTSPIRYVAIDLGDKRTGLASGDSATGIVSPLTVIEVGLHHGGGLPLLEAVARAVEAQLGDNPRLQRGEVVMGVPLNMDGTAGPRVQVVRAFAARLQQRLGRPVHEQDERLTSVQADWDMAQTGLTHQQKKERRDALAAAAILNDYLEARKNAPADPTDHRTGDRGVW